MKRFQQAMIKTSEWANKNQAASGAILTKYTKIAAAPDMKRSLYGTKLDGYAAADRRVGEIRRAHEDVPRSDLIAAEAR